MILRRLAEGVRKQDWFTVVVEVLIVVVGIFLGLQVDDWNNARKESKSSITTNRIMIASMLVAIAIAAITFILN